jgi:transposase
MNYSIEFKLTAIKLYTKLKSIRKVAKLLECSKLSLHRWIERYYQSNILNRKEYPMRKSIITDDILVFIKKLIKKTPAIILSKIKKEIIKKFNISISKTYIYYIIRYKLNITYKQLRQKYYPEKKLSTLKKDKINFYNNIINQGIKKLISIDETGFYLNMSRTFGRCDKGKRCYKTVYKYPYIKYNFICAIKYGKVIGYKLYERTNGGIDKDKFINFYNDVIKDKYKNYLLILDNARFHKSKEVIENINKSNNKILYSIFY